MRAGSRALFVQVAASVPEGHFAPEDVALLAEYARTATLARYASGTLGERRRRLDPKPMAGHRPGPCGYPPGDAGDAAADGPRSAPVADISRKAKVKGAPPSTYNSITLAPSPQRGSSW